MMTLEEHEKLPGGARLTYQVSCWTPGPEGTCLKQELQLFIRPDKSWCTMKIDECEGATHGAALDRMVTWLRRLADGIEKRTETTIPL